MTVINVGCLPVREFHGNGNLLSAVIICVHPSENIHQLNLCLLKFYYQISFFLHIHFYDFLCKFWRQTSNCFFSLYEILVYFKIKESLIFNSFDIGNFLYICSRIWSRMTENSSSNKMLISTLKKNLKI